MNGSRGHFVHRIRLKSFHEWMELRWGKQMVASGHQSLPTPDARCTQYPVVDHTET